MKHLKAILIDPIVRHPCKFLALILFGAVHKVVADLKPELLRPFTSLEN